MNKSFANTTFATLAIAAGFVAFTSFSAEASVTSKLQNCRYDSREKVISCCEKVVRLGVRPYWMIQSGGSCASVAVCKSGKRGSTAITHVAAVKPRCYIRMTPDDTIKGGSPDTPRTPNRGNNPTNGNTKPF